MDTETGAWKHRRNTLCSMETGEQHTVFLGRGNFFLKDLSMAILCFDSLNIWNGVAVCSIKIRSNCVVTRRTRSSKENGTGQIHILQLSEPWGILYKIYKN
jgi:hypothetical protein